jgi:hypothetical protein
MDWVYKDKIVEKLPEDCEAFVYIIRNLTNNKMYVGKKLAKFKITKPPLKGKKRKRRSTVESDWKEYWGSNDHLKADVAALGSKNFTREILHFCPSKGVASYLEMFEQVKRNVLSSDDYYNGIIDVRIGSSKILKEFLIEMEQSGKLKL